MKDFYNLLKKEMRDTKFKATLFLVIFVGIMTYIMNIAFFIFNLHSSLLLSIYSPFARIFHETHYIVPVIFAYSIMEEYKTKTVYQTISLPCSRYMPPLAKFIAYTMLLLIQPITVIIIGATVAFGLHDPGKIQVFLAGATEDFPFMFIALGIIGFTSIIIYNYNAKNWLISGIFGIIVYFAAFILSKRIGEGIYHIFIYPVLLHHSSFIMAILPNTLAVILLGIVWSGIYLIFYEKYGYVQ